MRGASNKRRGLSDDLIISSASVTLELVNSHQVVKALDRAPPPPHTHTNTQYTHTRYYAQRHITRTHTHTHTLTHSHTQGLVKSHNHSHTNTLSLTHSDRRKATPVGTFLSDWGAVGEGRRKGALR